MTSPKRSRDWPIESVELKISIKTDRETSRRIKEEIPGAVVKGGGCELRIFAEEPGDVAERAKVLMERLRSIERARAQV